MSPSRAAESVRMRARFIGCVRSLRRRGRPGGTGTRFREDVANCDGAAAPGPDHAARWPGSEPPRRTRSRSRASAAWRPTRSPRRTRSPPSSASTAAPLLPGRRGDEPGPPVLLVPPMMLAAEVYDVSPSTSAVTILREHGVDPWVVDFGAPEREEGGLERTLADHVLAVSDAVDRVRERDRPRRPPRRLLAGRDVLLPDRGVPPQRRARAR